MKVKWDFGERKLTLFLDGELDHHAAKKVIREIGELVDDKLPLRCTLDLEGVSFMDSSGIAVVLGLYRRIYEIGGELKVINVQLQSYKVLSAAGVEKIVKLFPVNSEELCGGSFVRAAGGDTNS